MKVKIFETVTSNSIEKQINDFLAQGGIEVLDVQYRLTTSTHGVLITYEDGGRPSALRPSRHAMDD